MKQSFNGALLLELNINGMSQCESNMKYESRALKKALRSGGRPDVWKL